MKTKIKNGVRNLPAVRTPVDEVLLPEANKLIFYHSKSGLHNFFADRMAIFSIILGYILETGQKILPGQTGLPISLYHKLVDMRTEFLNKYHQLNFSLGRGVNIGLDSLIFFYELIYRFERRVVNEILNAGINRVDLQEYHVRNLKLISKK